MKNIKPILIYSATFVIFGVGTEVGSNYVRDLLALLLLTVVVVPMFSWGINKSELNHGPFTSIMGGVMTYACASMAFRISPSNLFGVVIILFIIAGVAFFWGKWGAIVDLWQNEQN